MNQERMAKISDVETVTAISSGEAQSFFGLKVQIVT